MGTYQKILLMIFFIILCMYTVAVSDVLNHTNLHIGTARYAEILRIPGTDVMPLNTLVNLGYVIVGLYWCGITKASCTKGILKSYDPDFFFFFNTLACAYGTVSVIRMITQGAVWAIIDRWTTLLFFALVPLWASHIRGNCKPWLCVLVVVISFLSYPIIMMSPFEYETVVACHILCAIFGGITAYAKHLSPDSLRYFLLALVSCALFVSGNLFDLKLPSFSFFFNYFSGHFISRVFDAGQIFFVNAFFFDLTLEKAARLKVEEKRK